MKKIAQFKKKHKIGQNNHNYSSITRKALTRWYSQQSIIFIGINMRKTTYCQFDTMKDGVNSKQGITLRTEGKTQNFNFPSFSSKVTEKGYLHLQNIYTQCKFCQQHSVQEKFESLLAKWTAKTRKTKFVHILHKTMWKVVQMSIILLTIIE